MQALIFTLNKLQNVFNAIKEDSIKLPQVVVLGEQSSGKSSLIENLVGKSFLPRGVGIVTRRPLILQLVHNSFEKRVPECLNINENSENCLNLNLEWGEFLHQPNVMFKNFTDICQEIDKVTNLVAGTNKGISSEPIHLRIYTHQVINLTLIDLPGIIKVPVGDQPKDIENQIYQLIVQYISNQNSIILTVIPANTDMATSQSLQLARSVDPDGNRTLAVVTKLDLMDAGTDALDILCGRIIPVKLGIIGVVNRSQQDIIDGKSIEKALHDEAAFFQKQYPTLADCNGTKYLIETLNCLFMQYVRDCLPNFKSRVNVLIDQFQTLQSSYDDKTTDQNELIIQIITKFVSTYNSILDGTSTKIETTELCGGARICYIFHEIFRRTLNQINPLAGLIRTDILTAIKNANGARPALFIPEVSFELLVKKQIVRLLEPSLRCVDLVYEEMERIIQCCVMQIQHELLRFPQLYKRIFQIAIQLLRNRLPIANAMIENLISIELAYINTVHPDFHVNEIIHKLTLKTTSKNMVKSKPDNWQKNNSLLSLPFTEYVLNEEENTDCSVIESLIVAYFSIVKKSIQDMVPKAIMHFLVNFVKDNLQSELVKHLYKCGNAVELLDQSAQIVQRRKEVNDMLNTLQEANKIIYEIQETYTW